MNMRTRPVPFALLGAAVVLAGCGPQPDNKARESAPAGGSAAAPSSAPPAPPIEAAGSSGASAGGGVSGASGASATASIKPDPAKLVKTKTGLQYEDVIVGSGKTVKAGNKVTVHYTGTLTNGTKFDSSLDKNQPFEFTLGVDPVIQGWVEGLIGMKEGGRRRLVIPPALGYKDQDMGKIPPNSTLLFDIELLQTKTANEDL
jgi:peptidylprolyl isomerase